MTRMTIGASTLTAAGMAVGTSSRNTLAGRLAFPPALVLGLLLGRAAAAAETTPPPEPAPPPAAGATAATSEPGAAPGAASSATNPPVSAPPGATPPPSTTAPPVPIGGGETVGGVPMVDASVRAANPVRYGFGARVRLTSVPSWMLNLFTRENVPLTSYAVGAEFFRRASSFDLVLGLGYHALSPGDGNWLGKGNPADVDTDFVQFRSFGMVSFDAAFVLHTDFSEYFGLLYGGGVGIGVVTGDLLRTSAGTAGCATAPGDERRCYPVICTASGCDEQVLKDSENGGTDTMTTPHRFSESRVPAVVPIVNILMGMYFRVPSLPGLELRLEGGFFLPYFFAGLGVGYRI